MCRLGRRCLKFSEYGGLLHIPETKLLYSWFLWPDCALAILKCSASKPSATFAVSSICVTLKQLEKIKGITVYTRIFHSISRMKKQSLEGFAIQTGLSGNIGHVIKHLYQLSRFQCVQARSHLLVSEMCPNKGIFLDFSDLQFLDWKADVQLLLSWCTMV